MSLDAAIVHITTAVHDSAAEVTVVGPGGSPTLVERLGKMAGHRQCVWEAGGAVDDGEGGATTVRWRLTVTLRVAFLLSPDEQRERTRAVVAMSKVYQAVRDSVLTAGAATAGIVAVQPEQARAEPGAPPRTLIMAMPVVLIIRGDL